MGQMINTFSADRVRTIYQEGLEWKRPQSKSIPPLFHNYVTRSHWTKEKYTVFTSEERSHRAREWTKGYFQAAQAPDQHITDLDQTIASLLRCHYGSSSGTLDEEDIIAQTCVLLRRLPATPHLPGSLSARVIRCPLDRAFFQEDAVKDLTLDHMNWDALKVTRWLDTNTIRLALAIIDIREAGHFVGGVFRRYIDTIAELIQTSLGLSKCSEDPNDEKYWLIAQSFLWTSWYRSVMLYSHYLLDHQLRSGFDWERNLHLDMRLPLPDMAEATGTTTHSPQHMCAWAFELLKSERAAIVKDFRGFRGRLMAAYGDTLGRCLASSSEPCSGRGPTHCQRFTGLKIVNQSAHDFGCKGGCRSLLWDEHSYRSVDGPRAVSISATSEGVIRYCQASDKTIAVSHVWSHGTGGRPETGFNVCLHKRLVRLAQSQSCDSYWMDTPCVPKDRELRREAISHVNTVYKTSKLTLVWDRDIMPIDISEPSIATYESLLCVLLVCDWNIRAWTLLESMRARHNLHLLCRDNRIVSVKECLLNVHSHGAVDIASLFLTAQHFLPAEPVVRALDPNPSAGFLRREEGFVSVEESIGLLAYRHASSPGDSTTIMSLLNDRTPLYTPEEFWKSQIGNFIRTGLLFSSQPRVQCKGLFWAPAQPEVLAVSTGARAGSCQQYFFFDGSGTDGARITADRLPASFATFEVPESRWRVRARQALRNLNRKSQSSTDVEASRTALVSETLRERFALRKYRRALLLLPLHQLKIFYTPPYRVYRGKFDGPIFGVVGSDDKKLNSWRWLGVHEWDPHTPWPKLRKGEEKIFLI